MKTKEGYSYGTMQNCTIAVDVAYYTTVPLFSTIVYNYIQPPPPSLSLSLSLSLSP